MNIKEEISNTYAPTSFYLNELLIEPSKNSIIEKNQTRLLQPKLIEVLIYLCAKAPNIVSMNELINRCWPNQFISDSPVHKCIAQLRKALGDNTKNPQYIKTIPKKGYVIIACVNPINPQINHHNQTNLSQPITTPYPGLLSFSQAQQNIFFGREKIIDDIHHWASQSKENTTNWLSLFAPVKAGKSSLVNAGIIPALIKNPLFKRDVAIFEVQYLPDKPHYIKLIELLYTLDILSNKQPLSSYISLLSPHQTDSPSLRDLNEYIHLQQGESKFVLFIDQLEVIIEEQTLPENTNHSLEIDIFFSILQKLLTSNKCLLITTIQSQYLIHLKNIPTYNETVFQFEIPEFSYSELSDLINKPAALAGLTFEYSNENREFLNDYAIQQLQINPFPIQVIQHLLNKLNQCLTGNMLTYNTWQHIGGFAGCLVEITDQQYIQLSADEKQKFNFIFFHLLTLDNVDQQVVLAPPCLIEDLAKIIDYMSLNKFIALGLLQFIELNNQQAIQLVHKSLIYHWPVITQWLAENLSVLYIRKDLEISTLRWVTHNKNKQLLLLSNNRIREMKSLRENQKFVLSSDENEYITSSTKQLSLKNTIRHFFISLGLICFISLGLMSFSLIKTNTEITKTRVNAENLISFILFDLKDKLEPLGKLELLNIVADKTLQYFELSGTENLAGKALIQWVEALHILGDVNISKNKFIIAESYFKQTETALQLALKKDEKNEKLLELYMLTNYWLGYSAYLQLDYQTAEPYLTRYLKYANELFSLYPKVEWHLEISYALNNLGSLAEKSHQLDLASSYFEQSAQIKLQLIESQPNDYSLRIDLADTLSWQSNLQAKSGNLTLAISYLQKALSQVEKNHSEKEHFKNIEHLYSLQHKLALLYFEHGDLPNASKYSNIAQKNIAKLIYNDNDNFYFKNDLLWSQLLSIRIFIHQNNPDQALLFLNNASKLIFQLKKSITVSENINRANVYLLQLQAQTLLLLKIL